jgi:hypothetical protein
VAETLRDTRAICTLSLGDVGMNADESLRRCCTVHGHALEVGGDYEPCHVIRLVTDGNGECEDESKSR